MSPAAATRPPPSPAPYPPPLSGTARWLGAAGMVPFVLGALLVWLVNAAARVDVALALSAYAALVVSFLGGIHWGLGMRQSAAPGSLYFWGVVPPLLAWVALLMPPGAGLVVDGMLLVACYLVDRRVYPVQGVARWLTLRFRLSAVAASSCFLGAAGS